MSETILKALMRLFAIIADVDKGDISTGSHSYVETYLRKFLNEESVGQYLDIFNHYLKVHHKEQSQDDPSKSIKHTASDSVKVLTLCHQINEELRQNQKVLVLIQLLEFVAHNIEITKDEMEFIETVASAFNISRNEYENCRAFILDSYKDIPEKENVLIINSKEKVPDEGNKHFYVANLSGIIIFLFIKSTNTFIFKYFGDDNLSLNGHDIIVRRAYTFDTGASIRSSRMNTIYYSDITNQFLQIKFKTNLVLTAENVSFQFKNSENGIINFNFSEETGELIGVMGGSGVGKSTLLHILIGNIIPDSGKITINGYDLNKDREKLEGIIGFIPQDDLLIEELTVFQNLYYNTKLCFDNLTNDEIRSKVEKVLKELDLYEIRNLKVGDVLNKFISGGQRKRLNIALELIREPSILFVDEPTSGLSSKDSFLVMDLLKELTLRGKLIIANIHQPSSDIYKMFDKLIILDKGGYSIFYGNPIDAVVHFKTISHHINALESECLKCGNVNPEQIFEIVEAKVVNEYGKLTSERKISPKTWYECCHKHVIKKIKPKKYTPELPENQFKVPGKFKQFKVFITRDILSKLSNTQYMLINFLEAPFLAGILGYFTKFVQQVPVGKGIYKFSENENLFAYLYMAVIVALFLGLTVSAEEIIKDRKIVKREKFLNLSRFSYINAKILILFIISAIQMLTFVLIGNFILEINGMTLSYWLILFSTAAFANMLGLNISSSLNSVITIYILIPFILVPKLLFAGVIVPYNKLHEKIASYKYVPLIGEMRISRWAYEALAVHQFKDNKYEKNFYDLDRKRSQTIYFGETLIRGSRLLPCRLDQCLRNIEQNKKNDDTERNLLLIRNEFKKLKKFAFVTHFQHFDSLYIKHYNKKIRNEAVKYLDNIGQKFNSINNKILEDNDKIVNKMILSFPDGNEGLIKLKQEHYNEKLAQIVSNKVMDISGNGLNYLGVHEAYDEFIQIKDPVYKYPESNFGRAHFYAPVKKLFGIFIDTYWFDCLIIWLAAFTLYLTLLHDTLRKILTYLGNINIIQKFSKKPKRL